MDFSIDPFKVQSRMAAQSKDDQWTASLKRSVKTDGKDLDKAALREACRGFEEVFLKQILKDMRKMATGVGGMKAMAGSNLYWDLMDSAFASELAKTDTLGIGKFVYESLVDQMERIGNKSTPAETPKTDLRA